MCPTPVATTSDNRLRNCLIARSITSWPICSQQVCTTSFRCSTRLECDDDVKQAIGVLPRSNSLLGLSLCYSAATFLAPQILAHEDALVNGRVFISSIYYVSDDVTQSINYRRIFKCIFLFCLLICLCTTSVKDVTFMQIFRNWVES